MGTDTGAVPSEARDLAIHSLACPKQLSGTTFKCMWDVGESSRAQGFSGPDNRSVALTGEATAKREETKLGQCSGREIVRLRGTDCGGRETLNGADHREGRAEKALVPGRMALGSQVGREMDRG